MNIEYSIIIPTYNRIDILPETLSALEQQIEAPRFEIIVINDGSNDGTREFLESYRSSRSFRVFNQLNQGPAAARNAGIRAAVGDWIGFLGDDTVPDNIWLSRHARRHAEFKGAKHIAVVGYTSWHRRINVTPFLHYLNEQGPQFGYSLIRDSDNLSFAYFYTSNITLSREVLMQESFNETFPYPAYEDTELGYRLVKRWGLRLVYEPSARVEHDHPTDYQRFAHRQQKAGYSAVVFFLLHRELRAMVGLEGKRPPTLPPSGLQRWREFIIHRLEHKDIQITRLWREALKYHYLIGLHKGWSNLVLNKAKF